MNIKSKPYLTDSFDILSMALRNFDENVKKICPKTFESGRFVYNSLHWSEVLCKKITQPQFQDTKETQQLS